MQIWSVGGKHATSAESQLLVRPMILNHAQRFVSNQVHSNLLWALGYNIVAIPLAAGALLPGWGLSLSPALAGAIMSCSSVAVVANSLLLRRTLERKLYKGLPNS